MAPSLSRRVAGGVGSSPSTQGRRHNQPLQGGALLAEAPLVVVGKSPSCRWKPWEPMRWVEGKNNIRKYLVPKRQNSTCLSNAFQGHNSFFRKASDHLSDCYNAQFQCALIKDHNMFLLGPALSDSTSWHQIGLSCMEHVLLKNTLAALSGKERKKEKETKTAWARLLPVFPWLARGKPDCSKRQEETPKAIHDETRWEASAETHGDANEQRQSTHKWTLLSEEETFTSTSTIFQKLNKKIWGAYYYCVCDPPDTAGLRPVSGVPQHVWRVAPETCPGTLLIYAYLSRGCLVVLASLR